MSISQILEYYLHESGKTFSIERDGKIISKHIGLMQISDDATKIISFKPNTDILVSDFLISDTGDRFYACDKDIKYENGEPERTNIYVESV